MVEALRKRKAHEDAVGLTQKRIRLEEQENKEQLADIPIVSALSMPLLQTCQAWIPMVASPLAHASQSSPCTRSL